MTGEAMTDGWANGLKAPSAHYEQRTKFRQQTAPYNIRLNWRQKDTDRYNVKLKGNERKKHIWGFQDDAMKAAITLTVITY